MAASIMVSASARREADHLSTEADSLLPDYDPSLPLAAHTKRFFERWLADSSFRNLLAIDAREAQRRYGLIVDPEDLRYLWDEAARQEAGDRPLHQILAQASPATRQLFAWIRANHRYRKQLRDESRPTAPRFDAWRSRQIARSATSFRAAYDTNTPHITMAIELSRGCSVGCWFCGVSAPRLGDVLGYDAANAALFREVLQCVVERVGVRSAARGFLYWASDPFDNPDYERFCLDFQAVCGLFPLTTTALALRDTERTRRFIAFAAAQGAPKLRFSVSTLRQLDRLHEAFTAEELKLVDIITLNKGSLLQPSPSGRARDRLARSVGENDPAMSLAAVKDQTISCVSGFLLNLVDRRVQLISPCNADDRWPLGYFVYADRRFRDAGELGDILDEAIRDHMPVAVPLGRDVRFRPELTFRAAEYGFTLAGPHGTFDYHGNLFLRDLGLLIAAGDRRPDELVAEFAPFGIEEAVKNWIDELFRAGVLDEAPLA